MKKRFLTWALLLSFPTLLIVNLAGASLLNPDAPGLWGSTYSENYDYLLNALTSNDKVVAVVNNKLWVPWFTTSSECSLENLHRGSSCNTVVSWENNCMVSDEFSQVGVLLSMGRDQGLFQAFYNTVTAIKSVNGDVPAWRILREGDLFKPCEPGINGNCDTASDATARIIIALLTAGANPFFTNESAKQAYKELGLKLSSQFVNYEVDNACRETGQGSVCYWLAAGSEAKKAGIQSNSFAYTGYFGDAVTAMLFACAAGRNEYYCDVAKGLAENYLAASNYQQGFTTPPGRSFRYVQNGALKAECSQSCSPVIWDDADAPRAFGVCQSLRYASLLGVEMPRLKSYCDVWVNKYLSDPSRAPLQYRPDGSHNGYLSGFFAQALQSLAVSYKDQALFEQALRNALNHFSPQTKTWDYQACFGVYHQSFPLRSLGFGIGRDEWVFTNQSSAAFQNNPPVQNESVPSNQSSPPSLDALAALPPSCNSSRDCFLTLDYYDGSCRRIIYDLAGEELKLLACNKEDGYAELYRQTNPSTTFTACLGSNCVDKVKGFARFKLDGQVVRNNSSTNETVNETALNNTPAQAPSNDSLILENNSAPSKEEALGPLQSLKASCFAETSCSLVKDYYDGSCRRIIYDLAGEELKLLACNKEDGYAELYRQTNPSTTFTACLGSNCVDKVKGFARFKLDGNAPEREGKAVIGEPAQAGDAGGAGCFGCEEQVSGEEPGEGLNESRGEEPGMVEREGFPSLRNESSQQGDLTEWPAAEEPSKAGALPWLWAALAGFLALLVGLIISNVVVERKD